jgi:hypothetical protein
MSQQIRAVKSTEWVNFDENFKTFRLYSGQSLYAFCISPELTLEHLYWGKRLHEGFDLRYLSQSCRPGHFTTVEAAPHSFDGKIVVEAETLEEVQRTWRENKVWSSNSGDDSDYVQKKRLENYSWRIMSKMTQQPDDTRLDEDLCERSPQVPERRNSISFATDPSSQDVTPAISRRRSFSNPAGFQSFKVEQGTNFKDLQAMAKLKEEPSPVRFLENLSSSTPPKRYKSRQTFERQLGKLGKGVLCVEYTDHGTGDFRSPSLVVVDNYNGSSLSPLRYRSHKIFKGKLPLEGMPSVRSLGDNDATTLVVTLSDAVSGLEVDLIYGNRPTLIEFLSLHFCVVAMHDYDCITRRAVFRNNDRRSLAEGSAVPTNNTKVIQKASSVTIDFECAFQPFHLLQLSGR